MKSEMKSIALAALTAWCAASGVAMARDDDHHKPGSAAKPQDHASALGKPGDYKDPGWFKHPEGTVAFEWTGEMPTPARFQSEGGQTMPARNMPANLPQGEVEVQVRKPTRHSGH